MFLECLLRAQHLGCEQNRQEMRELDSKQVEEQNVECVNDGKGGEKQSRAG